MLGACVIAFSTLVPMLRCGDEKPVRVTVVVVLATAKNDTIDPILTDLAKEVRKREPKLTGFKVSATECKSITVGNSDSIPLVDKQELKVKIEKPKDEAGRISLTISPPKLGDITYACTCDKYLPVVTPYRTAKGETLIIAVMAKPCTLKK